MNAKVKEFVLSNRNSNAKWKVDENMFSNKESIPNNLLEKKCF